MADVITNPPPPGQLTTSDGQVSDAFYRWLLGVKTGVSKAQNTTDSAIAALQAATFTDVFTGFIPFVANQNYPIAISLQFPITSALAVVQCTSGSCTATWKKSNTTIYTQAVNTSRATNNNAVAFADGDDLNLTLSGNSNCRNLAFSFYFTRPLLT